MLLVLGAEVVGNDHEDGDGGQDQDDDKQGPPGGFPLISGCCSHLFIWTVLPLRRVTTFRLPI
jgi:hypothetical protein